MLLNLRNYEESCRKYPCAVFVWFSMPFKFQGMQFTGLCGKSVFSFVRNHQAEFQSCFMFCVVISNVWDFCCSTSSQSLDTVSVPDFNYSYSVVGWFLKIIFLSKYNSHTIKVNWVVSLYSLSCATSLLRTLEHSITSKRNWSKLKTSVFQRISCRK